MTRRPLALLWLAAGCTVGSPLASDIADAPGSTEAGAPDASNGCVKASTPNALHMHAAPVVAGNLSNAGQPCLNCHSVGGTPDGMGNVAPPWQFAGTVYHADGTTPYTGIHIRIVGSDAQEVVTATDAAGNFYIDPGLGLTNAFPGHSFVTQCPDAPTAMTDALAATTPDGAGGQIVGGNCNGCHTPGGAAPKTGVLTLSP